MTGYQEVLTDPSYYGQIVVMTAPHIGNTGVNLEDEESVKPWLSGFVVRAASPRVSNWRATASLDEYLRDHGVVGITGVDTRALVRHIREAGALRGVISSANPDPQRLVDAARAAPSMEGLDLVPYVTCAEPYHWAEGVGDWRIGDGRAFPTPNPQPPIPFHVVAYDFGIKRNILRLLAERGCRVTVVPATTPAAEALALKPDGVFLSNGPGDPAAVTYASRRCAICWAKRRCSASAWGTRSWGWRWAAAPTSCASATTAATSRCASAIPARSKSPATTTASRSTRNRCRKASRSRTST